MSDESQQIFDAALGLPEAERALLASRLLESLEPELEELTEDELAAELDRRRAEIDQGIVTPIPWSQVRFEPLRIKWSFVLWIFTLSFCDYLRSYLESA